MPQPGRNLKISIAVSRCSCHGVSCVFRKFARGSCSEHLPEEESEYGEDGVDLTRGDVQQELPDGS
jgi:hypothetical protein